jgi:uncharacterized protein with PQ loop repeat
LIDLVYSSTLLGPSSLRKEPNREWSFEEHSSSTETHIEHHITSNTTNIIICQTNTKICTILCIPTNIIYRVEQTLFCCWHLIPSAAAGRATSSQKHNVSVVYVKTFKSTAAYIITVERKETKKMGFHHSVSFLYCCCCWLLLSLVANNSVVDVVTCASSSSSSTTPLANTIRVIDKFKNRLLSIRQQYQANDDKTVTSLFSSHDGGSIYYGIPRTILDSNFQRRHRRRRGDSGSSSSNINENNDDEQQHNNDIIKRQQYYEEYETIGKDVEKWALKMIREETTTKTNNNNNDNDNINDNGWKEIYCSKAFRHKFNTNHNHNHNNNNNTSSIPPRITTTRQYIKWIPDSRDPKHQGSNVNHNNNSSKNQKPKVQLHPCMKLIATIHAPSPIVCRYLSDRTNFQDYNSLLIEQKDLKIINSYSKICWSQSKKLCKFLLYKLLSYYFLKF